MKYLGFVLLVLSGYVMAEEVYYCSDNHRGANGFHKNEKTGQYERSGFNESKFKMKLQDDGNIVIIEDDGYKNLYFCSILGGDNERKSCVHQYTDGSLFNFNQDNGRYIMFEGFGYVFGVSDTVAAHIGTCTKF
jgi:hypothetical protein